MGSVACTLEKTPPVVTQRKDYRWEAEGQLIAQIVAGRKELFTVLIEPHLGPLFRLIRAKVGNDSESDDVIQQTIFKAFTRLEQFRFEASFRTWLIRIALNEVVQWHRKRLSTRLLVLDHSALAQLPIADQTASPLKQCERREAAGLFRKAYAMLPEKYQVMIRLRDLEHLSIAEVAKLLSLSVPAVKTRHRRARLRMVSLLAPIASAHMTPGLRMANQSKSFPVQERGLVPA
jgi:RNA polymerase sigma-70 factor (ECF subfamily)